MTLSPLTSLSSASGQGAVARTRAAGALDASGVGEVVCECVSGYGWLVVNDSDSHGATAAPAASLRDFRRQAATHLPCDLLAQEVRAARGVLGLKFHATPIIHNCGCICEMQTTPLRAMHIRF